ncbi:hypothetical protein GOODEAATRI_015722 [Goodea atripinnis]|uniref:Cytospin-A n=1 Tax=Goodea atripinnis TaxID=208336 RepID=A0ABV0MSD4_9TELE
MMGNHNGKEVYGTTGSPLDFYHTPPTSRSEAELIAMALPSAVSTDKVQTSSPVVSTTPSSPSPAADWKQQLATPSEWAMISVESVNSLDTNSSDAAAGREKVVNTSDVPIPLPLFQGSPSEQSWQERDSGMEPQAAAERAGEMLRRLITEKDDLVEELDVLKETLRTERLEWQQFQWDLQTAVSVADRLRLESDNALGLLQENHRALKEQLAQTLSRQQETERALESLRVEHKDVCCKLNEVIVQWQQEKAEHDVLRNVCRLKDEITNKQANEEAGNKLQKEAETEITDGGNYDGETHDHEKTNGLLENVELTGKGVAEGYIRSLAALEKKKEEGRGQRDPRTIVMLSERSWSLSGLPLQSDSSSQDGTSKNIRTTLPLCKKEEPTKGRRMDRTLQRQDSWSNFYTGKQEEDQTSDSVK